MLLFIQVDGSRQWQVSHCFNRACCQWNKQCTTQDETESKRPNKSNHLACQFHSNPLGISSLYSGCRAALMWSGVSCWATKGWWKSKSTSRPVITAMSASLSQAWWSRDRILSRSVSAVSLNPVVARMFPGRLHVNVFQFQGGVYYGVAKT